MNNKHKHLLAVASVLLITVVIVGFSVACNSTDVNLSIKSDKDEYTLMSGSTGDTAEITAEEFNAIAEKLSEIEFIENEEKFSGWSYSVSYSDEGKNHKLVIVNANKVTLDGKNYDVKDSSDNTLYSYMVSLGNKYFK